MLILPLKFVREEDKKTVGLNLYNLAKLGTMGLPIVESVIVVPPALLFQKVVNKYLRHNIRIHDYLNNVKNELLNLPFPESLKDFERADLSPEKNKFSINTKKLWDNLLQKWTDEIMSRISREEKDLFKLTPQLVIFSANFSAMGKGFFDEDRGHAVIKTDKGTVDFKFSSLIENLIIIGNKKLLLPQVYYWGIEDGELKIIKVTPFTQSVYEDSNEKEKVVAVEKSEENKKIKTATKIFLNYHDQVLNSFNFDGAILNIEKLDTDSINNKLEKISKFDNDTKIIFFPDYELSFEKNLKYGKEFLFFRNNKKINAQIILPETFSLEEFLNLKREYAALGIYSKGSLKIWKQFNTAADFLNLDDYLDAGFDGAVIDLDKIAKIVCGVEASTIIENPKKDQITALEKFFKELGLSKIIKNLKPVLLMGRPSQNEELLNYFIKVGVWGIAFDRGLINPMKQHINFLERQVVKKLPSVEVQH